MPTAIPTLKLTPRQRKVLAQIPDELQPFRPLHGVASQIGNQTLRALRDRGLYEFKRGAHGVPSAWRRTDAGRAALAKAGGQP